MAGLPTKASSPSPSRRCAIWPAAALAVGVVAYACAFYAIDPGGWSATRGELTFRYRLLIFDDVVREWFGKPAQFAIVDRLPIVALAGGVVAWALALGRILMRLLRAETGLSRLEVLVFSGGLGFNALSLVVLLAGLAGALDRWRVFLPLCAATWIGLAVTIRPWRGHAPSEPVQPLADRFLRRWPWLAAPFVAVILLGSMLPPYDFDVLEYHLQAPKEYFLAGRIEFLPHNVYAQFPLGTEMFSLLAMVLCDDWWYGGLAGKAIGACFAPLTAIALFAAGRRWQSPAAGAAAALCYISIPWIANVSTIGMVEGASAFHLCLAVHAVLLARTPPGHARDRGPGRLLLAGALAGGAVSCKYPAALFVVLPLSLAVAWPCRGDERAKRLSRLVLRLAVFLAAALAACGPWFVKNAVQTGNPTYPLLVGVFDGRTRTPEKDEQWLKAHSPSDYAAAGCARSLTRVAIGSEYLSPLVVPLALAGLVAFRRRALAWQLAGYFGWVIAAWWLFTHRIDRFWIPALPVLALLAGLAVDAARGPAWRNTYRVTLAGGLVCNFALVGSNPVTMPRYFVDLQEVESGFLKEVHPWQAALNEIVPDGASVLCVGDAAVYNLRPRVLYNTAFDYSVFERICRGKPPEDIRRELVSLGVSHVYVNWDEIRRYRSPGNYGFTDFVQPEVFDELVKAGVLSPSLPRIEGRDAQVFPVRPMR